MEHTADWWLGDLDGPWFQCLESAVHEEWGVAPLRIREGGVRNLTSALLHIDIVNQSIPSVPFLEKEFKCHALHLPMGQSMVRLLFLIQLHVDVHRIKHIYRMNACL